MTFHYVDDQLHAEGVPLIDLAERFGTPLYVYSKARIADRYRAYESAFADRAHRIFYAVKANSNLAILNLLHGLGAGFDVVSIGELMRVEAAGASAAQAVFAGVGKTRRELEYAISNSIECINVESVDELNRIDGIASSLNTTARVAVRVNPDVDPQTHPYISTGLNENKFGVPMTDALEVYRCAQQLSHVEPVGVSCHIGSQLTELAPFEAAADRVQHLIGALEQQGVELEHVDLGGGLGIAYQNEQPPAIEEYVRAICAAIDTKYRLVIEPGRSMVGDAGLLLTEVLYLKSTPVKTFVIVDASMTELIRPALYQATHRINAVVRVERHEPRRVDVVGPVCETADFLAKDVELTAQVGDLLAVRDVGAYGAVMMSTYNSRPRPAEILVDGERVSVIRERDSVESLFANEKIPALE